MSKEAKEYHHKWIHDKKDLRDRFEVMEGYAQSQLEKVQQQARIEKRFRMEDAADHQGDQIMYSENIKKLKQQLEKEREENKKLISLLRESALAIYLHVPKKKQSDMEKYFDKHGYKIDDCENCFASGCSECDFTGLLLTQTKEDETG